MMFTAEKAYPRRYKLVAHRGFLFSFSRGSHPLRAPRGVTVKNSNFACATDKTVSSYIWTTDCLYLVGFYEAGSRGYTALSEGFP